MKRRSARPRRFVHRAADGTPCETGGQRLFDFADVHAVPFRPAPSGPDAVFRRAVELENAGRQQEAADAYREWLVAFGPDPVVCFNLGMALYACGQREAAVERLRQAVEINPEYVEAWVSLGGALSEVGRHEESLAASRRALQLDPACAEAVFNLADTLQESGRAAEARRWWETYLLSDADSRWAAYARVCLQRT